MLAWFQSLNAKYSEDKPLWHNWLHFLAEAIVSLMELKYSLVKLWIINMSGSSHDIKTHHCRYGYIRSSLYCDVVNIWCKDYYVNTLVAVRACTLQHIASYCSSEGQSNNILWGHPLYAQSSSPLHAPLHHSLSSLMSSLERWL